MSTDDNSDEPLLYRFVKVHTALKVSQESKYESDLARKEAIYKAMSDIRKLDQDIDKSDLFSPNEMIEDVQTPNLKYLLLPYIFGEFLMNCSFGYENRLQQIKEASILFGKFIDRLDLLLLVTPDQKKLLNGAELNPAQARGRKIADFQREKTLMPKLREFHQKWAILVHKDSKAENLATTNLLGTTAKTIEKAASIEQDGEVDVDEVERDTMIEILCFCVDKVISFKKSMKQEEQILEHHKQQMELRELEIKHGKPANSLSTPAPSTFNPLLPTVSESSSAPGSGIDLDPSANQVAQFVPAMDPNNPLQPRPVYNPNPTVSTSGVSTGGLRVHQMKSSDEAKGPIPEHMKDFMVKPGPPANSNKQSQQGPVMHGPQQPDMMQMQGLGPSAGRIGRGVDVSGSEHQPHCPMHPHQVRMAQRGVNKQDVMTDEERLSKPWFNATAGSSCECTHFQDVTLMSDYVMSAATRGGRGKLVKLCPTHKVGTDVCGCDQSSDLAKRDFINDAVALRTDRTRVFRDRNPYLMEVEDFARMKIEAGELPGIKDRLLADRIKADEERHRLRVENGESDDESTLLTQKELDDIEDAETMKMREWDDWADDHQKGAGNKNYRR